MRNKRWLALLAGTGLAVAVAGCFFGKPMDTKYYLLDYIPTPPKERLEKGPYPYVLRVRDCNIAEAYRRSQIVYRQSANQMEFYGYHLWAVDPDRMIGDLVIKHLKAARLFENVTRTVENYVPNFYLGCDIQAIEEYDGKEEWFSHLAIEYQLEDAKSNQIIWKRLYDLRKKVAQQEPVYVVRELSALLETINDRMVQEMEVALDEYKYNKTMTSQDSAAGGSPSGNASTPADKAAEANAASASGSAATAADSADTANPAEQAGPAKKTRRKASR